MYKVQKPCKVCGKMYTPCADCENDKTMFRWRTVACSIECGRKYFELVENARKSNKESSDSTENMENEAVVETVIGLPKKTRKTTKTKNNKESEQID